MGIICRSLGGRPLRRRREMVLMSAHRGCKGPQPSRPPPNLVATAGWAIAGRSPGGRPLRRRREMVLMSATGGCEGPQLQAPTDYRYHEPIGEPVSFLIVRSHRGAFLSPWTRPADKVLTRRT